jgi:RND family efflux transporter MFP subunit
MPRRAGVVLGILAAGVACRVTAPPARNAPEGAPPRTVRTAEVLSTAPRRGFAPATVAARSQAVLSARTTATVTALPFREGDRFSAGAVLVRLDDRALAAALAAAQAEAAAAEAERARTESLLAKAAATPREAEQARARAGAARAGVLSAQESLAYAELRAPFAGTVAARPVHVGDVVSPGTPLLEIEGLDGLELRATLGAIDAAAFRPGSRIEAAVDGVERPITATVRSISPAGDPATHRFQLRADLPTPAGLRSGLFARLAVPSSAGPARLVVPAGSVFVRGGLTGVYVISDGRARLRWIAVADAAPEGVEVRAGLEPGERVAFDPSGLEDGTPAVEAR